jgi:double-strand break repair protein MRE11
LQKHVYGQKEHKFDVFCYEPNFKNENLSIELPIFIIHGNHDDPSGFENFSSIDIFSNREVNYFGKVNNYEEFDLYPILFIKGTTKIALYGIGNIKDERLYLALQNKKVNFHRPEDYKSWFNILIVHQNRFKGHHTGKNKKNYLPESFIPSFFDLVIWGHEHETFTEPVYNNEVGFHVFQPGSSVVTSLIQAESKPKHIGVLEVCQDKFRIVPVKLESVRPFMYQQIELKNLSYRIEKQDDIEKIIEEKIEEMLSEVEVEEMGNINNINGINGLNLTNSLNKNKNLPILRIKIEFSGYQITRTNFIVSKFAGR